MFPRLFDIYLSPLFGMKGFNTFVIRTIINCERRTIYCALCTENTVPLSTTLAESSKEKLMPRRSSKGNVINYSDSPFILKPLLTTIPIDCLLISDVQTGRYMFGHIVFSPYCWCSSSVRIPENGSNYNYKNNRDATVHYFNYSVTTPLYTEEMKLYAIISGVFLRK